MKTACVAFRKQSERNKTVEVHFNDLSTINTGRT